MSWIGKNPEFSYKLWTDDDIARFVAQEFPALLPVFSGYRDAIARVDLARYLILKRFGGVYADLDSECLRPVAGLIDGHGLVIGVEPREHEALGKAVERGLTDILCPTFIASVPGHPFWDHALAHIVAARHCPDVLDATGPFLLTRAHRSYTGTAAVTVVPAERLYPATKDDCWSGRLFDLAFWERATRPAYALHHWEGSWFRPEDERDRTPPRPIPLSVGAGPAAPPAGPGEALPTISCLMVTSGRAALARQSIEGFVRQTYPNRELVIVDDSPGEGPGGEMERLVRAFGRPDIRLIRLPDRGQTLGALRNVAVAQAAGRYVCQWDDDDLHDPQRLEYQYAVLARTGARACLLGRCMVWWPDRDRLAVSCERDWENSLLCEKASMPRYPDLRRGEDTPLVEELRRRVRVVRMDLPRLYTYVAHGANTFGAGHFEAHWNAATERFTGDRCRAVLEEMGKRLPVREHRRALTRVRAAPAPSPPPTVAVSVFGHLTTSVGLGTAARGTVAALQASGLPVTPTDWPLDDPRPDRRPLEGGAPAVPEAVRVNVVHTNPDALLQVLNAPDHPADVRHLRGAFTIGCWVWEGAEGIPATWRAALPLVDEIWVPSAFTAAAVAPHVPVPVVTMPHAVATPAPVPAFNRHALGIPQDAFCFLFMFDATSNVVRKNPDGLIRAYRAAFPDSRGGTLLVVKAKKLGPAELAALEELAAGRPDIRIVNEPYAHARAASLLAACDVYVSLHRAEGFGLTIAEAMACGKPVIATGYSGNMDFMTAETAWSVPYRLCALDRDEGYYPRGTVWADPDLETAARLMRRLAADPEEAKATGARAARWIRARLGPAAIGRRMRERLERLAAAGRLSPATRIPATRIPATRIPAAPEGAAADEPDVLVLIPVKDARVHLPRCLELLDRLDHDPARLSVAFLESDSSDGSHAFLAERLPALRARYRRAELLRHDYGFRPEGPRWAPAIQRRRREILARSRNRLLGAALRDEEWVLWLDADLADYPPDLLRRLLAAGRDVVVPHCVLPDGRTFDLNTFVLDPVRGAAEDPRHLVDGLYQPPPGEGRAYLDAFADRSMIPVDGVGGTALLVRADLHREGLCFPPVPYRGYIETEGLARMARDMGVACWGLPDLRIVHTDA